MQMDTYADALRQFNSDAYALCKLAMRDPSVGVDDRNALRKMCGETDKLIDSPARDYTPERTTA